MLGSPERSYSGKDHILSTPREFIKCQAFKQLILIEFDLVDLSIGRVKCLKEDFT